MLLPMNDRELPNYTTHPRTTPSIKLVEQMSCLPNVQIWIINDAKRLLVGKVILMITKSKFIHGNLVTLTDSHTPIQYKKIRAEGQSITTFAIGKLLHGMHLGNVTFVNIAWQQVLRQNGYTFYRLL